MKTIVRKTDHNFCEKNVFFNVKRCWY